MNTNITMYSNSDFCDNLLSLLSLDDKIKDFAVKCSLYVLQSIQNDTKESSNKKLYIRRAKLFLSMLEKYEENDCINIDNAVGLVNIESSCYLDSIITPLLLINNKFINDELLTLSDKKTQYQNMIILKLQEFQRNIISGIHDKCTELRKIFKYFPTCEEYNKGGEKDSGEFMTYIFTTIFNVNNMIEYIEIYGTNSRNQIHVFDKRKEKRGNIKYIEYSLIQNTNKIYNLQDFLKVSIIDTIEPLPIRDKQNLSDSESNSENIEFYVDKKIRIETIIDADFLIYNIERLNRVTNKILNSKIIPNKFIILNSGKMLALSIIVIYQLHHYYSYFRVCDTWYYYNDIIRGKNINKIGSYENLLTKQDIFTQGVQYIYT